MDACTLAGALKRNLLLSLAEAEFFRVRWSTPVLDETEKAIHRILDKKGCADAAIRAARARQSMEEAFEDAIVTEFDRFLKYCDGLPDQNDAHVLAGALKTGASVIVTENLKHFPVEILAPINLDVRSAVSFIADTVALDDGRGGGCDQTNARAVRNTNFNRGGSAPAHGGGRADRECRRSQTAH